MILSLVYILYAPASWWCWGLLLTVPADIIAWVGLFAVLEEARS